MLWWDLKLNSLSAKHHRLNRHARLFVSISQGLHVHAQSGKRTLSLGVLTCNAFSVQIFSSVMRLRLSSVCTQGDLACDLGKTQQAGAMMQPVTVWLSLFYLENTSHLPPNSFTAPLTQMCHQLHAESEECCLKSLSLYTGRLIVPISLPAPQEFRCIITEEDTLLMVVAHRRHHMTVLTSVCVMELGTLQPKTLVLFILFTNCSH